MATLTNHPLHRPAEWLRHACTILAWPGRAGHFAAYPNSLAHATDDVSCIAEVVARFEPVTLLVDNERLHDARRRFKSASTPYPIKIHPVQGNSLDLWMRDIAPTYVLKHRPGGQRSDTQTERILSSIVTEGGAIEVDGEGTLLVTESSVINENRNPGKTRQDIEIEFKKMLGVEKVIWIPGRKGLDITDCHIDALARFVRPGTVLLSKPNEMDGSDWTQVYKEAREVLLNSTDARGRHLDIVEIREASLSSIGLDPSELQAIDDGKEDPLVMSYVNYLLVNGGIIVPQFGDRKMDANALKTVRGLFGIDREAVPVLIRELPFLGGGIHCATQEVPNTYS